jgi:hypothetical protein
VTLAAPLALDVMLAAQEFTVGGVLGPTIRKPHSDSTTPPASAK